MFKKWEKVITDKFFLTKYENIYLEKWNFVAYIISSLVGYISSVSNIRGSNIYRQN